MAELFLARDTRRDALVVIKRILPYLSQEAEFVQMFLDEARIAAQLHHPNVIEVFELGKLEDSIFIAMEYVDGVDLRKVLAEELKQSQPLPGSVPYGVAAWICARICDGLHEAHNRLGFDGRPMGIIHRDISPQNVMVGYDGRVKLVDFGIARANAYMERSKPGVIKGKFLYLAPEQLTQEALDHRADLWALGVMLYEVTTGKSPFYKSTTEAVILAIRTEDPPPPHLVRPDYPLELSRIVMRCLSKDRSRRYAQAGEIARDLDLFLSRLAPVDEAAVADYVGSLFGTEGERTMLHIPGSAPKAPAAEAAAMKRSAPPSAPPVLQNPPRRAPTLSAAPTASGGLYGSAEEEPRTQMARPQDLQKPMGRAVSVVAAPALVPPPARRFSGQGFVAAGSVRGFQPPVPQPEPDARADAEGEGTHTFVRPEDLELGERSEASLTPSFTPSATPSRTLTPPTAPRAPAFSERRPREEISSSAPKPWATAGDLLVEDVRRLRMREDEADDESTMDGTALSLSTTSTTPGPPPVAVQQSGGGRRVIIAALTVAILIVAVAGAVRLWRQAAGRGERLAMPVAVQPQTELVPEGGPSPQPGADAEPQGGAEAPRPRAEGGAPVTAAAVADGSAGPVAAAAATPKRGGSTVPVVFRAPAGTRITVGKKNYVPNRTYQLAQGTQRVFYACPRGYSGRGAVPQTFAEVSDGPQQVSIACKRK